MFFLVFLCVFLLLFFGGVGLWCLLGFFVVMFLFCFLFGCLLLLSLILGCVFVGGGGVFCSFIGFFQGFKVTILSSIM